MGLPLPGTMGAGNKQEKVFYNWPQKTTRHREEVSQHMGRVAGSGLSDQVRKQIEPVGLSVAEAMRYGNVGKNTLLKALQEGKILGRKIGKRRWIVFKPSLEQWLKGEENNGQN